MNLFDMKDMYYQRILDVIPSIVFDHLEEMKEYKAIRTYLDKNPIYKEALTITFQNQTKALFLEMDEYWDFIRESEKEGFELGKAFAADSNLALQLILVLTNSTRICSLKHFLSVLQGTQINEKTSILIERVFELSNYRQNAFFRGYVYHQNQQLRKQSITDPLTNAFNRRHFYDQVIEEMKRAYRINYPLTLMLIDIDNLKVVNDQHGHIEGDKLLKHFTNAVTKIRSDFDSIFRFGGDEFVLLLPNCTEENATEIGYRLNNELCNFNDKASLSFGSVELPKTEHPEEINIDRYINLADVRMYESKHALKKQF